MAKIRTNNNKKSISVGGDREISKLIRKCGRWALHVLSPQEKYQYVCKRTVGGELRFYTLQNLSSIEDFNQCDMLKETNEKKN